MHWRRRKCRTLSPRSVPRRQAVRRSSLASSCGRKSHSGPRSSATPGSNCSNELINMGTASAWNGDWAWSLPLIVVTAIFHVIGLGLFNVRLDQFLAALKNHRPHDFVFVLVMGVAVMWATFLHAVEAGVWAVAYRSL